MGISVKEGLKRSVLDDGSRFINKHFSQIDAFAITISLILLKWKTLKET